MTSPEQLAFDLPNFEYDSVLLEQIADYYLVPDHEDLCRKSHAEHNGEGHYSVLLHLEDLPEDFRHLKLLDDLMELFSSVESMKGTRDDFYRRIFFFNIVGPLEWHIDHTDHHDSGESRGLVDNGQAFIQGPHGGVARSFGFNLPIKGCDAPTCWKDRFDGDIIHEHYYSGPALINTEEIHGVPDNQGQRLLLSVGGFWENLRDVKNLLTREGKVF